MNRTQARGMNGIMWLGIIGMIGGLIMMFMVGGYKNNLIDERNSYVDRANKIVKECDALVSSYNGKPLDYNANVKYMQYQNEHQYLKNVVKEMDRNIDNQDTFFIIPIVVIVIGFIIMVSGVKAAVKNTQVMMETTNAQAPTTGEDYFADRFADNANTVSDDMEEKLRKLKRMYDQGLITEEEYADKKKECLHNLI